MIKLLNLNIFFRLVKHIFIVNLLRRPDPYKLDLILTYNCNSFCKTCRIWKKKSRFREIGLGDYEKLFRELGKKIVWLSLDGGQPTLKGGFLKIVDLAIKTLPNLSIINISSNGLTPKQEFKLVNKLLNKTKGIKIYYALSLDGFEKEHNIVRGRRDAYRCVMEAFSLLSSLKNHKNLILGFQTTINKYNLNCIPDILRLSKNADFHTFNLAHYNRTYFLNRPDMDVTNYKEETKKVLISLLKRYKVRNLFDFVSKICTSLSYKYLDKPQKRKVSCSAGISTLTIDPYGNIKRCAFDDRNLSNIKSGSINLKRDDIFNVHCKKCWMDCEATPSMILHPILTLRDYKFF